MPTGDFYELKLQFAAGCTGASRLGLTVPRQDRETTLVVFAHNLLGNDREPEWSAWADALVALQILEHDAKLKTRRVSLYTASNALRETARVVVDTVEQTDRRSLRAFYYPPKRLVAIGEASIRASPSGRAAPREMLRSIGAADSCAVAERGRHLGGA